MLRTNFTEEHFQTFLGSFGLTQGLLFVFVVFLSVLILLLLFMKSVLLLIQ